MQNARMVECRGLRVEGSTNVRSGLTLIELLVVIIILTTVVAAAIPILAPSGSDRAIREATRGVNTYITGAQTRATALRRPFGIALKRLSQDTNTDPSKFTIPAKDIDEDNGVCLEVYYVEQQPPYSGFSADSRVCVCLNPSAPGVILRFVCYGNVNPPSADWLPIGWDLDLFPGNTIQPGDVIEIGDTRYRLGSQGVAATRNDVKGFYPPYPPSSGTVRALEIPAGPTNDTGQLISIEYDNRGRSLRDGPPTTGGPLQKPYWTAPMPYKILRQPTATTDPPYQLPEGTAIDLRASGVGRDDYFYVPGFNDNSRPVLIMFTPEGRVDRVSFSQLPLNTGEPDKFDESVVDNVFLMVGKRENVPPATAMDPTLDLSKWNLATTDQARQELKEPINWLGGESRWVVIGSQSGRVVSLENAFVDPGLVLNDYSALSSDEKRNQQILAAREFTSDMASMGGR